MRRLPPISTRTYPLFPSTPPFRSEFADHGLDQRRLAGAIGTEQADAVAGFEAEAHLTKDRDPLHLLGSLPFKGRAGEGMGFAWLHAMFFTARNPIPTLPSP